MTVYLPDELYRQAREEQLPISALAQSAIEKALHEGSTRRWAEEVRHRPPLVKRRVDIEALMDDVRDELGR